MKTLALRSLQTAFIVSAMTFLTGANGQGCGKVMVEEPPAQATPVPYEPPPATCAAGWHVEQVCSVATPVAGTRCGDAVDASEPGAPGYGTKCIGMDDMPEPPPVSECHDECVPDSPCDPGFVQTEVCVGPTYAEVDCGPDMDCAPPEPVDPACHLECVPAQCPVGSHAEWTCAGGGATEPGYPGEERGSAPSRPMRCMPEPDPQPMPDGPCAMTCVPDSQLCPPGSMEQTTCSTCAAPEPGQEPEPCIAECFTECVPFGAPEPMPAEKAAN